MTRFSNIGWTPFLPHAAKAVAYGGGTWCLTVELWEGLEGFVWHVAHSSSGRGSRAGIASSVCTAKAQAELAATELGVAALPVPAPARVEGSMTRTAYEVLGMLLGQRPVRVPA